MGRQYSPIASHAPQQGQRLQPLALLRMPGKQAAQKYASGMRRQLTVPPACAIVEQVLYISLIGTRQK
jgi:hypothetical protein